MDRLGEGILLRVGFLENATYPSGEYVATIAASNEFGDPETISHRDLSLET